MKNYIVIQDGIKECGSACLLSIIRYYGGNVTLDKILELTNTTKEGTNFYDLREAAYEIGLSAKAYKVEEYTKIYQIKKPFISQVIVNNYKHFIVIYKTHNEKITVMDPAKGIVILDKNTFLKMWTGYILILEPYKQLPVYRKNNFLLKVIKQVIRNNFNLILKLIMLTMITIVLTSIYGYHFKIILDNYLTTDNFSMLIITIIFIVVFVFKILTEYLRNNLLLYLNKKIDLSIITTTINKIISLPFSYYKNKTTGEVITRVNDLFYIKNIITKIITTIFLDMCMSISIFVILFLINKTMTLGLLIITIIYLLVFIIFKHYVANTTDDIQERSGKVNSLLVETISSYETIKGLNLEDKFINKINQCYQKLINSNLTLTKIINYKNFINDLFEGTIILFIMYLGITNVMDKSFSIGNLITYNTLLFFYLNPIRNLFDFSHELYYIRSSIKRLNNLLNYKYEKLDKESNLSFIGSIHINNLSFSYNNRDLVLKDITLDIKKGEKVLLLGKSGSGKSTLLKLLYRYYNVNKNKIFIGKNDLLNYELLDIRKNITYISQNDFIYTDTIQNNIILERNITNEEFLNVCKLVYVDELIKDNSLSYDMPLEENGVNISGGQRQRIILARALLKSSQIILIDEGLNEIDINLERKILKNIFKYFQDKTIIIISHRTDNMDLYDKVLTLENGSIKEKLERRK